MLWTWYRCASDGWLSNVLAFLEADSWEDAENKILSVPEFKKMYEKDPFYLIRECCHQDTSIEEKSNYFISTREARIKEIQKEIDKFKQRMSLLQ